MLLSGAKDCIYRKMKPIKLAVILLSIFMLGVNTIKCRIGVGQRGKLYENGIEWSRDCPNTKYCYEVVSEEISQFQKLFDYPFDSYYNEFYARSCGGDLASPEDYHPYRNNPKEFRTRYGAVKMNITTPILITGHGGTEELIVKYICRRDMCFDKLNAANRVSPQAFTYVVGLLLTVYWLTV